MSGDQIIEDLAADGVFCTSCGNAIKPTARFCTGCGSPQPIDMQPAARERPAGRSEDRVQLRGRSGGTSGWRAAPSRSQPGTCSQPGR